MHVFQIRNKRVEITEYLMLAVLAMHGMGLIKVPMIKLVRNVTGCDLVESKDLTDHIIANFILDNGRVFPKTTATNVVYIGHIA